MRSQRHERRGLSTWASVRRWENATRERLQRQHWLWLHGWCIGVAVILVMWAMAHLQMVTGFASLGLRYAVTLGTGYLVFLCILRWWAGRLVRGEGRFEGDAGIDLPDLPLPRSAGPRQTIETGGGGDFAGGGAQASFDAPGDSVAIEVPADTSSLAGDVASGALEVAGGADEGAVVAPASLSFAGSPARKLSQLSHSARLGQPLGAVRGLRLSPRRASSFPARPLARSG